ncbi:replication/maintenance protein RepL [Solirhodobacter olei]|uniref:replication/maintenance protein RepL n=1 Tax=Solirhodobacter olei TaxID=2493082 RepID=UPI000FDBD76F|nr:replication/maintenance protein RepL [Solirhodobacter olei]
MSPNDSTNAYVVISHAFQDTVLERLQASGVTKARRHQAIAVLWFIIRNLGWESYECQLTTHQLCDFTGVDQGEMTRALKLLEQVGAIHRLKGTRPKVITVSPEAAYFGDMKERDGLLARYQRSIGLLT